MYGGKGRKSGVTGKLPDEKGQAVDGLIAYVT
jgi:hypothetical protein